MKTLVSLFWIKEKEFWKERVCLMLREMPIGTRFSIGIIFTLILILSHYAFSSMHFLFESCIWIFNRKQFKKNLNKLYKKYEK